MNNVERNALTWAFMAERFRERAKDRTGRSRESLLRMAERRVAYALEDVDYGLAAESLEVAAYARGESQRRVDDEERAGL